MTTPTLINLPAQIGGTKKKFSNNKNITLSVDHLHNNNNLGIFMYLNPAEGSMETAKLWNYSQIKANSIINAKTYSTGVDITPFACLKPAVAPNNTTFFYLGQGEGERSGNAALLSITEEDSATKTSLSAITPTAFNALAPNQTYFLQLNDPKLFPTNNRKKYLTISYRKLDIFVEKNVLLVLYQADGSIVWQHCPAVNDPANESITLERSEYEAKGLCLMAFIIPISNSDHLKRLATFSEVPGLLDDTSKISFKAHHFGDCYLSRDVQTRFAYNSKEFTDKKEATFLKESNSQWAPNTGYFSYKSTAGENLYIKYDPAWSGFRVAPLDGTEEDKKNATFKIVKVDYSDNLQLIWIETYSFPGQYWIMDESTLIYLSPKDWKATPGYLFEVGDPEKDGKANMEEEV